MRALTRSTKYAVPFSASAFVEFSRRSKFTVAAVSLSVLSFLIVWSQMASNYFPPGDDPGNWLKRVNALTGKTYPLWDENIFTYPPFFFAVCHIVSLVLGCRLTALKIVAALAFASTPFTTFVFVKKTTGSSVVGLAAAWIIAFFPGQLEMLWWGAYPNLFALAIMPIALLALLQAQEGNLWHVCLVLVLSFLVIVTHHLTSLVYLSVLTIFCLASFVARDDKAAKANLLVLALTVAIFASIWAPNLSSYITRNPLLSKPGALTWGSLLSLFKDFSFLLFGLASAIIGSVQLLYFKRLREPVLILAWLFSPLLLTQLHLLGMIIDYKRFLYMISIPWAISASVPFLNLTNCVKVLKIRGEERAYEVEVQLEKAVPVLIASILLLSTPFHGLIASQRAYDYYIWQTRYSSEGRLSALNWVKQNTSENATILSDFGFGRWVEGYGERRALFPIPPDAIFIRSEFTRFQAADAILNSNHQLANRYLKLDEWQPMSTKFSPLISTYQGNDYAGLVYLSDSFVRVNLTRSGQTWVEAPYNSWLYQSSWLERNNNEARLRISFATMGLVVEKELHLQAEQPHANITYKIKPKPDVTLNAVSLSVFLMWGRTLYGHAVEGNTVTLLTDAGGVKVKFLGNLSGVEVGKDSESSQDRIYVEFRAEPGWVKVSIVFEILDPQPSWIDRVWAASSDELERDFNVTHISVPAASLDFDRFNPDLPEGPVAHIDDSFARVEFTKAGSVWYEAPYRASVIGEEDGVTMYETIALYINKTVVQHGPYLEILYKVKGKDGVVLERFELSVWLSWGRYVSDVVIRDNKVSLVTDAGALDIELKGGVVNVTYGPDEEFHMPRVFIQYEIIPDQDEVSLTFSCPNDGSALSAQVEKTTRPFMESSDKATINVIAPRYEEVFRNSEIVIFETSRFTGDSPH